MITYELRGDNRAALVAALESEWRDNDDEFLRVALAKLDELYDGLITVSDDVLDSEHETDADEPAALFILHSIEFFWGQVTPFHVRYVETS